MALQTQLMMQPSTYDRAVRREHVQRVAAGINLVGFAMMIAGLVLCVTASFDLGITVLPIGALLSGVARLVSRTFKAGAA